MSFEAFVELNASYPLGPGGSFSWSCPLTSI